MPHWCLNGRVLALVGALGFVVWLVAPAAGSVLVVLAAVVACEMGKIALIKRLHARRQVRAAAAMPLE